MNFATHPLLPYLASTLILFCWTALALRNWVHCYRTGAAPSRLLRWHFLNYRAVNKGRVTEAPMRADALMALLFYGGVPLLNSAILITMVICNVLLLARDILLWPIGGQTAFARWLKVEIA
jgi:hypothetical protein